MAQSTKLPEPVDQEARICFGIVWFDTEAKAAQYDKHVRARGDRYNGGWLDGLACGRDTTFDRTVDGQRQFAVTTA